MALKQETSHYTFKRKVYVGKMKRQGNQNQGIMAQMMYYMSESRLRGKIRRITDALEADPVDVQTLKELSISADGLITVDLRCKVWNKLLNVNAFEVSRNQDKKKDNSELKQFHEHKYWKQVNLDVDRSHRRFPADMRASRRRALQEQLVRVIMRVLCRNQDLHYYQGYHDVAVTLLLVVGEDLATALLEQLSLHQLRDFMEGTMEKTSKMLAFLHPIIEEADPELEDFLIRSEVGQVFALSWLITWYGHVLKDFASIVRLYDFFLATHPLMPVYFGAALVIRRRTDVLTGECEMSYVHHLLSRIPDDLPDYVEELITTAHSLFCKYPPEKLAGAVERYLKESMAVTKHKQFLRELEDQRPDSVLRQRKKQLARYKDSELEAPPDFQSPNQTNAYMKFAVWTLTASVGTVALYVLSSAKRWI
ncbi:TBC1 domain family member 20-like [Oculina patagonica]